MAIVSTGSTTDDSWTLARAARAGRKGVIVQNHTATDELMHVSPTISGAAPTGSGVVLSSTVTAGAAVRSAATMVFLDTEEAIYVKRAATGNVTYMILDL